MSSVLSTVGHLVSGITQPIATLASSALGAVGSYVGGQQTNSNSNANVAAQEQFQTASSDALEAFNSGQADTTYQRGVADLEAAGLNPMLAYSQGGDPMASGSSPSGSVAPVVNSLGNAMSAGISNYSALQSAQQTEAQTDNIRTQSNLNNALTAKAAADTTSALSSARATNAQATKTESGSLMSDVVGSSAAGKFSQYFNSAIDNATSKISGLINGITTNSAASAPKGYHNLLSFPGFSLSKKNDVPDDDNGYGAMLNAAQQ